MQSLEMSIYTRSFYLEASGMVLINAMKDTHYFKYDKLQFNKNVLKQFYWLWKNVPTLLLVI